MADSGTQRVIAFILGAVRLSMVINCGAQYPIREVSVMKTELGTEFVFHLLSGRAAASPRTLIALFLPFILSRYSSMAVTGNNRAKKQAALALKMSVNNCEVSLSET